MKQFIKLHYSDNNAIVIIPVKNIIKIHVDDDGNNEVIYAYPDSYGSVFVNESPERIFNMLEKE